MIKKVTKQLKIYKYFYTFVLSIANLASIFLLLVITKEAINSCFLIIARNNSLRDAVNILTNTEEATVLLISFLIALFGTSKMLTQFNFILIRFFGTNKYISELKIINQGRYNLVINRNDLAFSYGLIRPQIYISNNLKRELPSLEFEMLLRHEESHKNSRDPLLEILLEIFGALSLPYPGKNLLKRKILLTNELIADHTASKGRVESLGQLYNKFIDISKSKIEFSTGFGNLKERIDFSYSKNLVLDLKLVFITLLFILGFSFVIVNYVRANPLQGCVEYNTCLVRANSVSENSHGFCFELVYTPAQNMSRINSN